MRVVVCKPEGLLGQVIYTDLVDRNEGEAKDLVLRAFADRAKPTSAPSFPGAKGSSAPKTGFPGDFKPEISTSKLPASSETFVARENELKRLDAAWADPKTLIIQLVAAGGVGKSALVNYWLDRMGNDG